jgi:hypothetical protein
MVLIGARQHRQRDGLDVLWMALTLDATMYYQPRFDRVRSVGVRGRPGALWAPTNLTRKAQYQ